MPYSLPKVDAVRNCRYSGLAGLFRLLTRAVKLAEGLRVTVTESGAFALYFAGTGTTVVVPRGVGFEGFRLLADPGTEVRGPEALGADRSPVGPAGAPALAAGA